MVKHILKKSTITTWTYGAKSQMRIPLNGLETFHWDKIRFIVNGVEEDAEWRKISTKDGVLEFADKGNMSEMKNIIALKPVKELVDTKWDKYGGMHFRYIICIPTNA